MSSVMSFLVSCWKIGDGVCVLCSIESLWVMRGWLVM